MMRLPRIHGVIDRRILANFRLDAEAARAVIPPPFRPKLVGGWAIGGVCLIRLKHIRPGCVPAMLGVTSENAAHRFAVEWDDDAGEVHEGVFIPRRDTDSRFNALVGGRLFPGVHHHARFEVDETNDRVRVKYESDDGATMVEVAGRVTDAWPTGSVFATRAEASTFFEAGSLGYSATRKPGAYDGLELRCRDWLAEPLDVTIARSTYLEDPHRFPPGSVTFDCALLMRGIEHEWRSRETICCGTEAAC